MSIQFYVTTRPQWVNGIMQKIHHNWDLNSNKFIEKSFLRWLWKYFGNLPTWQWDKNQSIYCHGLVASTGTYFKAKILFYQYQNSQDEEQTVLCILCHCHHSNFHSERSICLYWNNTNGAILIWICHLSNKGIPIVYIWIRCSPNCFLYNGNL